ncbi:MAG: ABC transporter permease [Chloroflexi bacterium]|jgi:multiple sugar transport system permease protein|nr:ABC transporter permease [Chloroflexota bacterium]MDP7194581.1 sugar ABC transporter permease [SAR202 cluster bacterium]|tara:strand:- start:5268 stop:6161 length:894 start_codon:yes stop_codon:yes gene_type:complete
MKIFNSKKLFIFLMLLPSTIILLGLTIFPFVFGLILGFTDFSLIRPQNGMRGVGLENYIEIFTTEEFWISFKTTIIFTFFAVTIQLILGTLMAVLLHHNSKTAPIMRALYLLPLAVTPVAATFSFRMMFNPSLGVFNFFLESTGFAPLAWLSKPDLALISLIIVDIWQWTPFIMLIVAGGLASLPNEPFESAKVDGASDIQIFFHHTLPLLKPYLALAVIFRIIDAFKTFDIIYVLTGGGPGISTRTLNLMAYRYGMEYLELGYAASFAIIMLLIIILFSQFFLRKTNIYKTKVARL